MKQINLNKIKTTLSKQYLTEVISSGGVQVNENTVSFTDLDIRVDLKHEGEIGNLYDITKNGLFKLPRKIDADQYPSEIERGEIICIGNITDNYRKEFENMKNYLCADYLRKAMTGICIDKDNFCATDAHILKKFSHNFNWMDKNVDSVVLNPKTLEFIPSTTRIEISLNMTTLHCTIGGYVATVYLRNITDVQYPNFYQVLDDRDNYKKGFVLTKSMVDELITWCKYYDRTTTYQIEAHEDGFYIDNKKVLESTLVDREIPSVDNILMPVMLDVEHTGISNYADALFGFNARKLSKAMKGYSTAIVYENTKNERKSGALALELLN